MVTGLKPSWQNLKGSGFASKNPVEEMVGQLVSWQLVANNFGGNNIEFNFTQCQILKSYGVPYPYAEWTMSIKFSDSQSSGWGIFGTSVAEALGIDIELLDIDLLKGRWCHILQFEHEFGEDSKAAPDPTTGLKPKIKGNVFKLVGLIVAGQQVVSVAGTPAAIVSPTPTPAVVAPIAAPVITPAPVVVDGLAPVATIAPPPMVTGITPEQQALSLLHGKDTAGFFQVAVPDPLIRTDAALVNSILSNAFITAQIASGMVTKNADGTHSVVGM